MKAAVMKFAGVSVYWVLLPDKTITETKAGSDLLKAFLSRFKDIDSSSIFRKGEKGEWNEDDPHIRKGEMIAYITNDYDLVVSDFTPFQPILERPVSVKYLSLKEYAEKHGRARETVQQLMKTGRFEGAAVKVGSQWAIPEDFPYPEDNRMTGSPRYNKDQYYSYKYN